MYQGYVIFDKIENKGLLPPKIQIIKIISYLISWISIYFVLIEKMLNKIR